MATLPSTSGHAGGKYRTSPGISGRAGGGGGGGGGGSDYEAMAMSLLGDLRKPKKKRPAPTLRAAKKSKPVMDPMRYAQWHGQGARNAQMARGGMGTYGQGAMAQAAAEKTAREEAFAAYPAYMAMMQDSGGGRGAM